MWTWQMVFEEYDKLAEHPRPAWENLRQYSKQMLTLLPKLEAMAAEKNLQPCAAITGFELMDLNQNIAVRIMREESGMYVLQKFSLTTREDISTYNVEFDDLIDSLDALM